MPNKPGSRQRNYGHRTTLPGSKMQNRPRSRKEYHTARWTRLSRRFREANPLCARCQANGLFVPSQVTDHVIPVEIHGNFWDQSNWQPLCRRCNIAKGNEDKKLINEYRKAN